MLGYLSADVNAPSLNTLSVYHRHAMYLLKASTRFVCYEYSWVTIFLNKILIIFSLSIFVSIAEQTEDYYKFPGNCSANFRFSISGFQVFFRFYQMYVVYLSKSLSYRVANTSFLTDTKTSLKSSRRQLVNDSFFNPGRYSPVMMGLSFKLSERDTYNCWCWLFLVGTLPRSAVPTTWGETLIQETLLVCVGHFLGHGRQLRKLRLDSLRTLNKISL